MRLIDADAFERKVMCGDEEDVQDVIYSLRDFPTAYNIDKVVERLKYNIIGQLGGDGVIRIPLGKAIEIVKGGGVDE